MAEASLAVPGVVIGGTAVTGVVPECDLPARAEAAGLELRASAYLVKPLPIVTASAPRLNAPVTAEPAAVSKMPLSDRMSVSAV